MRFLLVLSLRILGLTFARDDPRAGDAILGQWLTAESESRIEIYKCDSITYCGRIVWLRDPLKEGKPVVDDKNPEESLRNRPVMGLELLRGFTYDGDGVWAGGKIYDPKSGNDYSAKMRLTSDSTLNLRGYVLIPLFGRTEGWVRVKKAD
ncbi:MAG: DUF2147 domain-containing protein [Bacteroidota bacterium]